MRGRARMVPVAALSALLLTGCGVGIQDLPLGRSADGDAYRVTLQIATADGLVNGADVRLAQRVIGRVAQLHTDTVGAAVTLSLESAVELPRNIEAAVEIPTTLGSPYIRLIQPQQPEGAALAAGDVIVESRTEIGPKVETALAALGAVLGGSGLDQLDGIVRELNIAFDGRSDRVRDLTATLTDLMRTAADHEDDLARALALAQDVSAHYLARRDVLDNYLDSLPPVVDMLVQQRDAIASLISSTARLATQTNALLARMPAGPDALVGDAADVVAAMDAFNDRIGATLTNVSTFLDAFRGAVAGDYLLFDGALDIPGGIDAVITGGMASPNRSDPVQDTIHGLLTGGGR